MNDTKMSFFYSGGYSNLCDTIQSTFTGMLVPLTLSNLMNFSILINWMSPFPILVVPGVLFIFILFLIDIHVMKQCRP